LLLNMFFPIVDICALVAKLYFALWFLLLSMYLLLSFFPTNLCNGAQLAIFDDFLRPVFAASRVQHVSELHLKIRTKATPCVQVWQTSTLRRLRLGEEKR